MKMAKSYKIVLLLTAFILALTAAVCSFLTKANVEADTATASSAASYFTGLPASQVKFADGNLVVSVKENSQTTDETDDNGSTVTVEKGILSMVNTVAINDFEIVFLIPDGLKSLTVVFNSDAYYANGNITAVKNGNEYKKVDGEYVYKVKTEISNEIDFDFSADVAKVNGAGSGSAFTMDGNKLSVKTAVTSDGYVKFVVGAGEKEIIATDVTDASGKLLESKKVKNVADVSAAKVKFMFELNDAKTPVDVKIASIDQKASDASGNYKQTFELGENGVITDNKVYPVIALAESFYNRNADGEYFAIKTLRDKYTLSMNVYSILGNVKNNNVYIQKNENIWRETNDTPKGLMFLKEGITNVNLVALDGENEIVYKTITVDVKNFANDDAAPVYVYDEGAYKAFEVALYNAYYDVDNAHYAALGSDVQIPSMKDLVFDDYSTYESLTKKIYYDNNNSGDLSSSGMSISLSEAGKYVFKAVFTDDNGNAIEKEDVKDDFIFNFKIEDDAPIVITAAPSQGVGYKGVAYTASKFKIDAVGCTTSYTLYYNNDATATEESDGWVVIPKASAVTDKEYDENGYSYEDVQSIAYNGTLTFTPNKTGVYMIKCSAVSSVTSRGDEASTLIKVENNPVTVKVYTDWLANNVWSVVFLSIGTLCLIGIIVLLCIKPKDETDAD